MTAFGAGLLVGTGLTTRSIDQSFRRLAQERRRLDQREQAFASMLAQHRLAQHRPAQHQQGLAYHDPPRWRQPAYQGATPNGHRGYDSAAMDDDD
ncbi:MAG TPA: hypothetical protein VFQ77_07425 [Pseudonocardiaceae bacterium]|nr:hypothetical protein [Pseudonocardiaceae bacterium]